MPIETVPSGPETLHVTDDVPSPVRIDAVSTRTPLTDPPAGCISSTTGKLVTGAHGNAIDWICCTGDVAGRIGSTPYVYDSPAVPPTSMIESAVVVVTSTGDAPACVRNTL